MRGQWKRRPSGYMSADGEWWLERGAPMAGGNTNAWLIHRRVGEDRIGREGPTVYDTRNGDCLWSVDENGYTETVSPDFTGPLYAHEFDAGSLAEAKYVASIS